jgi:ABC-type uncharacterized transport system permease subunit
MGFFKDMFKDTNDINEKSVVGFMSFMVMVIALIVDLVTGYLGKELVLNEYIYNSFVIITLGAFGISGIEKFAPGAKKPEASSQEDEG